MFLVVFVLEMASLKAGWSVYSRPVKNKCPQKARETDKKKVQQRIAFTSKGAAVPY